MKIKKVLITLTVSAAAVAGAVFGAGRLAQKNKTPVNVVPVANVDQVLQYEMWGFEPDEDNMYGEIVSRSIQRVPLQLESGKTLKSVEVKKGDEVKAGDVLMVYDVQKTELEREKHDLDLQLARLTLTRNEVNLETIRAKNPGLFVDIEQSFATTSADQGEVLLTDDGAGGEEDADSISSGILINGAEDTVTVDGGEEEALPEDGILTDDEEEGAILTDGAEGDDLAVEDDDPDDGGSNENLIEDETDPGNNGGGSGTPEDEFASDDVFSDDFPDGSDDSGDILDGLDDDPLEDDQELVIEDDPEDDLEDGFDTEDLLEEESEEEEEEMEELDFEISDDDIPVPDVDIILSEEEEDRPDAGSILKNTTNAGDDALEIRAYILAFLRIVNVLTDQYTEGVANLKKDDLDQAGALYRETFTVEKRSKAFVDPLGEKTKVSFYVPSKKTRKALKELQKTYSDFSASDTLRALHQASANYLLYRMLYLEYQLKELLGEDANEVSITEAELAGEQISDLMEAYYELYFYWRYLRESVPTLAEKDAIYQPLPDVFLEELQRGLLRIAADEDDEEAAAELLFRPILGGQYTGYLSILVDRILEDLILEEETDEEETETETEDDYDYDDEEDDSDAETAEELREAFFAAMMNVRSQRLAVREAELTLKQDDEKIDAATVKAAIDGVVRSAGSLKNGTSSTDSFIVITGEKGMYATGTISELKRDTIKVGDIVNGTSEETGAAFTATITELSDYPATDDDGFFYNYSLDTENTNASKYVFYAFIEDADGVEEGTATMRFASTSGESTKGVLLEDFFVISETGGKYYVMVRGEKGLLEKRYVKLGTSPYGYGTFVTEGLTDEDLIAFPYGDSKVEGAPTVEVEYLDDELYG